ncbi:hypothetical protein QYM36_008691 [Artemia franciscana]|uniref:Uncharacterized protein n=1 Tax=Artemia franciscana TaxID=6661 RepID=A0AA88L614_ARTSF|nr:hypothetical protein QYM36_008691 [Artemia franciscana]
MRFQSLLQRLLLKTKIVQPPGDTRVIVGHIATMYCKVSSDSSVPYEIKWFHDNREIDDSRINRIKIHLDGNLEIREARASDAGFYNCSVQSPDVSAFRLLNTPKTVNLSWIPAFDGNSKILNWVIQRRVVLVSGEIPETLDGWITETSNISADQRWYLLTNLKAAAAYQLRVSANNSVGEGPPSEPSSRVILPQEVPSGPPVDFELTGDVKLCKTKVVEKFDSNKKKNVRRSYKNIISP